MKTLFSLFMVWYLIGWAGLIHSHVFSEKNNLTLGDAKKFSVIALSGAFTWPLLKAMTDDTILLKAPD